MISANIKLRPLTIEDADISYKWRNDKLIWAHTGSRPDRIITREIERKWARKAIDNPTRANFAIMLGDRYIGNAYLVDICGNTAGCGIFIGDKAAWGHGYGRMALDLLKDEARTRGIMVIRIGVNRDNIPALVTYLKCGAVLPRTWDGSGMIPMTLTLNNV